MDFGYVDPNAIEKPTMRRVSWDAYIYEEFYQKRDDNEADRRSLQEDCTARRADPRGQRR